MEPELGAKIASNVQNVMVEFFYPCSSMLHTLPKKNPWCETMGTWFIASYSIHLIINYNIHILVLQTFLCETHCHWKILQVVFQQNFSYIFVIRFYHIIVTLNLNCWGFFFNLLFVKDVKYDHCATHQIKPNLELKLSRDDVESYIFLFHILHIIRLNPFFKWIHRAQYLI